jgi:ABC-type uncharacterized transport system substrate-binding protein
MDSSKVGNCHLVVDGRLLSCCCTARSYLVRRKPADLPVEQVTPFQTVLNLATTKKLGPLVPSSLLLRADEVFE